MADGTSRGRIDFADLNRRLDEADRLIAGGGGAERRAEVLHARARALAASRTERAEESAEVLAFQVGGERYAVHIDEVDQVLEARGIFPLAGAPRHVLGAMVARSRVVPVLDLRLMLGLEGGGLNDLAKVVVVSAGEDLFGLAVEVVDGKLALPRAQMARPASGPFVAVTPDRLAVLDLAGLGGEEPGRAPKP